jgi:hypothetical protein
MPARKRRFKPTALPHPAASLIDIIRTRPSASALDTATRLLRTGGAGEYAEELRAECVRGFARVLSVPNPSAFAIRTHAAFRRIYERPGRSEDPEGEVPLMDRIGQHVIANVGELPFLEDGAPNPAFQPSPREA